LSNSAKALSTVFAPKTNGLILALAGLLTYSGFERLPVSWQKQWPGFVQTDTLSLQQRDCPGFSPDSLFICFPRPGWQNQYGGKGNCFSWVQSVNWIQFSAEKLNWFSFWKTICRKGDECVLFKILYISCVLLIVVSFVINICAGFSGGVFRIGNVNRYLCGS